MYQRIAATLLLCSLSLCLLSICRAVEITDCGSKVGKFTSVNLTGCDMSKSVCILVQGSNATISIDFTTDTDILQVYARVYGIIMDIPIPFPLRNANACEHLDSGIKCPLIKNKAYHYTNTIQVLKSYPKLSVQVKWELMDEHNQDIVCLMIPAKIK